MTRLLELITICAACLAPMFVLAVEVDGDEFAKAGSGVVLAGCAAAVGAVYKTWSGHQ